MIDLSDWEDSDTDDAGEQGGFRLIFLISRELQPTNRWKLARKRMVLFVRPETQVRSIGTGTNFSHAAIPGPYPITPPPGQETVDAYYVVDHGREVGIFIDKYVAHMQTRLYSDLLSVHCPPVQPAASPADIRSG